jgi:hypothetical protein
VEDREEGSGYLSMELQILENKKRGKGRVLRAKSDLGDRAGEQREERWSGLGTGTRGIRIEVSAGCGGEGRGKQGRKGRGGGDEERRGEID